MTIHYRPALRHDLTYMKDLDLKCHEQPPADNKWWEYISNNAQTGCVLACKSQVPIGMCVWERQAFKLPDFKSKEVTLHIYKVCVRPEFRKQGIGRYLIAHAHEEANKLDCAYMSISVPEYLCTPSNEGDISGWLAKLKFKATIILPAKIQLYGESYDQFLFIYRVDK